MRYSHMCSRGSEPVLLVIAFYYSNVKTHVDDFSLFDVVRRVEDLKTARASLLLVIYGNTFCYNMLHWQSRRAQRTSQALWHPGE